MIGVLHIKDWLSLDGGAQFVSVDDYFVVNRIADSQKFKVLDVVLYKNPDMLSSIGLKKSWIIGFSYDNIHVYLYDIEMVEINQIILI